MQEKSFYIVTLGCAKNSVDAESIAQVLNIEGYEFAEYVDDAEYIIVNTCGFIEDARNESYEVLQELAQDKLPGQKLIAAGCLTQLYRKEVAQKIKGLDGIIGTRNWVDIMELIHKLEDKRSDPQFIDLVTDAPTSIMEEDGIVRAALQGPSAYLKIADGCRRQCGFCSIPLIKGTLVSRSMETILNEARILQANDIRELILIAQDTTDYGNDMGLHDGLAILLENLVKETPDIDWLRIMYAYPGYVSDRLIDVMASNPQIVPYIDIPLQHASSKILKLMRRPSDLDPVYRMVEKLRNKMPNIALRTTFVVGYPGETDKDFAMLMNFIEDIRFDRVGAFTYSYEPNTYSATLSNQVPEELKLQRQQGLMQNQQRISLEINNSFIGKNLDVLIEAHGEVEDSDEIISVGRSYRDAPEIDGMVFVDGEHEIGSIIPVHIQSAMPYDLAGVKNEKLAQK